MATGTLAPQLWLQVLDNAGDPVSGALVNFYASGTSSRIPAYADAALTTQLANPQACDSAGRLVYYLSATSYKLIVTTAAGVVIKTIDPVQAVGASGSGQAGSSLGTVFVFAGDASSPVTAVAYPVGTTADKTHAGTALYNVDSGNLAAGDYRLEGMLMNDAAGTTTAAIVDLSDGSPEVPLATIASSSATGARVQSSTSVTLPAPGAAKDLAVKVKVSAGNGFVWALKLVKIS